MYAIEDSGPYDEGELRAALSQHRKQCGEAATLNLTVIEMRRAPTIPIGASLMA